MKFALFAILALGVQATPGDECYSNTDCNENDGETCEMDDHGYDRCADSNGSFDPPPPEPTPAEDDTEDDADEPTYATGASGCVTDSDNV